MTDRDAGTTTSADSKLKIFISYSRKDEPFAQELLAGLEVAGFDAYIDTHDIAAGEDWEQRLHGLIRAADTVIFVVSPHSVASPRCNWEIERAESLGKRVLPIVLQRVEEAATPVRLRRLNYIYFDRPFSFGVSLSALAKALNTDLDWIREHTRLGELAGRWDQRGRLEALLIRGDDIADAKEWIKRRPKDAPEPTLLQQEFIAESEKSQAARLSHEAEQQRQLRQAEVDRERLAREKAEEQAAAAAKLASEAARTANRTMAGLLASLAAYGVATYFWYGADAARQQALVSETRALENEKLAKASEGKAQQRRFEALARLKEAQREKRRATEAIKAASATAERLLDDVAKAITGGEDAADKVGWEGRILNYSDSLLGQLVTFETGSEGLEVQRLRTRLTRSLMMAREDKATAARDETLEALKLLDDIKARVKVSAGNEAWLLRNARYIGRDLESRKHISDSLPVLEAVLSRTHDLAARHPDDQARQLELMQVQFAVGEVQRASKMPGPAKEAYTATLQTGTRLGEKKKATFQSADLMALAHERLGDLVADDAPAAARENYERSASINTLLVAQKPDEPRYLKNLTIAQERYIKSLRKDIKLARSDATLEGARAHIQNLQKRIAADKTGEDPLTDAFDRLGLILNDRGDHAGAVLAHQQYLSRSLAAAAEKPDDSARARRAMWAHAALRNSLHLARDFAGALPHSQAQLAIAERLAKDNTRDSKRTLMLALRQAGEAHLLAQQPGQARALAQRSFELALELAQASAGLSEADVTAARLDHARAYGELATVGIDPRANLGKELAILDELRQANKLSPAEVSNIRTHLSFSGLFAREFDFVIDCCAEPNVPIPEAAVRMNKAHALAFRGRAAEAKRIYMADVNRRHLMWGASTWEGAVLGDFAQFRAAGLTPPPLMAEIEALYAASFEQSRMREKATDDKPAAQPAAATGASARTVPDQQ